MPRASARVDVVVVVDDPDRGDAALAEAWWQAGIDHGWWEHDGSPGPHADACVAGGFARARIEHTAVPRLIANQLGGFRVRCAACGANAARDFSAGMTRWRGGDGRRWRCAACGQDQPLEHAMLLPPGAFTRVALHLTDAAAASAQPSAIAALGAIGPPARDLARRVG